MPSIYKQLKSSDRKFIRREKSRIRREILNYKKQEEAITELYKKILGKPAEIKEEAKKEEKVKEIKNKPKTKNKKVKKVHPVK